MLAGFLQSNSSEIPKSHVVSSPELASLAFFDKAESAHTKHNIVAALTKKGEDNDNCLAQAAGSPQP